MKGVFDPQTAGGGSVVSLAPDELLEAYLSPRKGPAVVAIGGGHGVARALGAISRYAGSVSAVVTVADDGGSSGRLASDLDIPPPGDSRQCLMALTPEDSVWKRLYQYRFRASDVRGHSLGNLILAALADLEGSFEEGLRVSERLLQSHGSVIPVANQHLRLEAMIDGHVVAGQVAVSKARGSISEILVKPGSALVNPRAVAAIESADQIVVGPGSLYTSVIATLVVPGLVQAINKSSAKLTYVSNLITQDGETLGMTGADHLQALLRLTGMRPPSAIVVNATKVDVEAPLAPVYVDRELVATHGVDVVKSDLVDQSVPWPSHDISRLGGALARLI